MCLTNTSAERIVNDMFSYVEETRQLETYLIRKDPVAITGNSTYLCWRLSFAVALKYTHAHSDITQSIVQL